MYPNIPNFSLLPENRTVRFHTFNPREKLRANDATDFDFSENSNETKLREEFAKTCFETLLQFSLLDGLHTEIDMATTESSVTDEGGVAGRLAVTALLHRFQEVLRRYIEDERRSGKCPLPR